MSRIETEDVMEDMMNEKNQAISKQVKTRLPR